MHREVQRAFDSEKAVIPFRIENTAPEKTLAYYIGTVHWLDALTPPLEQHLQRLAASVLALLQSNEREVASQRPVEDARTQFSRAVSAATSAKTVGADVSDVRVSVAAEGLVRAFHMPSKVYSVAYSPDGHTALCACDDGVIRLWDLTTGNELRSLTGHTSAAHKVKFSPDGRLALSTGDTTIRLWEVGTGKELHSLEKLWDKAIAFSPDGRTALCSTVDVFSLFELPTFRELRAFTSHTGFRNYLDGHREAITSLTFSPDGRTAVSGCMDHTIRLYQVASGKALGALLGHSGAIKSVAFSPDSRTILSSSEDTTLKLWDFATGKELRTFTGHSARVFAGDVSPDGHTILSGSENRTLKLWGAATGKELRTFTGHSDMVMSVAFSPDGRSALSGSIDTTMLLWSLT